LCRRKRKIKLEKSDKRKNKNRKAEINQKDRKHIGKNKIDMSK
jgi:hypothetical protein